MKYLDYVFRLPLLLHVGAALASIGAYLSVKAQLDASYAASKHPVHFFIGQTTFDGPTIKAHFAAMIETGTLDIFRQTQLIDFVFILCMALLGVFLCTLVARASRPCSWGRRIGIWAGLAVILGALCDAIENALSFILLADPTGFPDWLALPYSSFAAIKFGLLTIGMLGVFVSLVLAGLNRLTRKS